VNVRKLVETKLKYESFNGAQREWMANERNRYHLKCLNNSVKALSQHSYNESDANTY